MTSAHAGQPLKTDTSFATEFGASIPLDRACGGVRPLVSGEGQEEVLLSGGRNLDFFPSVENAFEPILMEKFYEGSEAICMARIEVSKICRLVKIGGVSLARVSAKLGRKAFANGITKCSKSAFTRSR
jgi:hypothetical protein